MKIPLTQVSAELAAIRDLMKHPGWAVLCAKHDLGVKQLTDQVLDVNQDDLMATRLRHARASVLALSPAKLAETIEAKHVAALQKAEKEAAGQ